MGSCLGKSIDRPQGRKRTTRGGVGWPCSWRSKEGVLVCCPVGEAAGGVSEAWLKCSYSKDSQRNLGWHHSESKIPAPEDLATSRAIPDFLVITKSWLKESSHRVFPGMFVKELAQRNTFHQSLSWRCPGSLASWSHYTFICWRIFTETSGAGVVLDAWGTSVNRLPSVPALREHAV